MSAIDRPTTRTARLDPESQTGSTASSPRSPQRDAAIATLHAPPAEGGALRGRPPPHGVCAPPRQRLRRPRAAERRRRARRGPGQARRLPRRQPLHDLGVQVRAARGGCEDPPPRVAGPRGARSSPRRWSLIARVGPTPQRGRRDDGAAGRTAGRRSTSELSPHQREVLVAVTLDDVPIDVLAERLNTTRGALYKTIHDARHKLRGALAARGLSGHTEAESS